MSEIPVLILAFRRAKNLEKILLYCQREGMKPYIFVDKAQRDNFDNQETQRIAIEAENMFKAKVYISERANGVGSAMPKALDWFFSIEDFGVILEDDCIPILPMRKYLQFAKNGIRNKRFTIASLSSLSLVGTADRPGEFGISTYPITWGWICCGSFWQSYRKDLPSWDFMKLVKNIRKLVPLCFFLAARIRYIRKKSDGWDGDLAFHLVVNNLRSWIPSCSYVLQLGNDHIAEHVSVNEKEMITSMNDAVKLPECFDDKFCSVKRLDRQIEDKVYRMKWKHILSPMKAFLGY